MERRDAPTFQLFLSRWRHSRKGAAAIFDTEDGRWALVSTSVTALVAGAVAWLAAGTAPQTAGYSYQASNSRSLLPYQVYTRLASEGRSGTASYAAIGPAASIAANPSDTGLPPASLDNALTAEQLGSDDDASSGPDTRTITMESGDTLAGTLIDAGVNPEDVNSAIVALRKVFDPRGLRTGQTFTLTFAPEDSAPHVARITYTPPNQSADDQPDSPDAEATPTAGKLLTVNFSPNIEHEITISRAADGSFSAQDAQKKLVARYHRTGGTIDSSLYLAAMQAGIPAEVVVQMIHIFSYQVDFQRDIHPGDKFQVLYNYYYTEDGKPAKQGVIDFAEMTLGGKTFTLYRYQPGDGETDYLDAKGRSAKSLLMKTPVDGARISSGFGMRYHPVLGYTRMHKGVDFAVPVGTPVMAAGAGVIKFEGRSNGYGNFLMIKHDGEYSTAYGHLSRFVPGLHVGSHVHQGQIVAYSGNTGMSTGPHLHYEIRKDGTQVNPLQLKIASGIQLKGKELRAFAGQKSQIDTQLASLPLETKVADNSGSGELRAAKN